MDPRDQIPTSNVLELPSFMADLPLEAIVSVVFTLIFIWWAIYSAVAVYHWFRYGRSSWVAVPAIVVHLMVSGAIFVYITSGLQ